ncbi:MAG: protein kinase [Alphaproteobacteria bacterium]|nr:protein kinase [Alphaproteobacteria bacterium]
MRDPPKRNAPPPPDEELGYESAAADVSGAPWGSLDPAQTDTPPPDDPQHPFAIEDGQRYERRQLLGRGGMGRVIAALDRRLRREVALKEVAPGSAGARLAREAWVTAQLEHPGIIQVYDAGRGPDGGLFYTMRAIRGRSLAETLREAPDMPARLRLLPHVLAACQAVAYAHNLGVLHRDLKPANIMVGEFGETQVVDWGLARPADTDDADWEAVLADTDPALTVEGAVVGTPRYMSPEQANGLPVDARSDTWSLGAVLYELIVGAPAFDGDSQREVLARVRRGVPPPLRRRAPDAPPELIAIVERAMAPEPADRYPDAKALAEDLNRYLSGLRVGAYSYRAADLLRRVARLWRVPLAVAGIGLLVVLGVAAAAWTRTSTERDRARAAEASAHEARAQADGFLADALIAQALSAWARDARGEAELLAAHALRLREDPDARGVLAAYADTPRPRLQSTTAMPEGCTFLRMGPEGRSVLCLDGRRTLLVSTDDAQVRWTRPYDAVDGQVLPDDGGVFLTLPTASIVRASAADGALEARAYSLPSDRGLFSTDTADTIAFAVGPHLKFLTPTGHIRAENPWCKAVYHEEATVSAQGIVAVACVDGTLLIGPPADAPARRMRLFNSPDHRGVTALRFSQDGSRLIVATRTGLLLLVDTATLAVENTWATGLGPIRDVRWAPDHARILAVTERGSVVLFGVAASPETVRLPGSRWHAASFAPDGTLVLVSPERLTRWTVPPPAPPTRYPYAAGVSCVALSPDGALLAASHGDGHLRVHRLADGALLHDHVAQETVAKGVAFTPDGRRVLGVYGSLEGIHEIDLASDAWRSWGDLGLYRRLLVLGQELVVGLNYGSSGPMVFRLRDGLPDGRLALPGRQLFDAQASQDGRFGVMVDTDGGVWRLAAEPGPHVEPAGTALSPLAVAISPDGERVAIADARGVTVRRWDATEPLLRAELGEHRPVDLTFSADNRLLAVGDLAGTTWVLDAGTGAIVAALRGHTERVASVLFSADSRTLYTGSWDGDIRVWALSALDVDSDTFVPEVEETWGLTLTDVLRDGQH